MRRLRLWPRHSLVVGMLLVGTFHGGQSQSFLAGTDELTGGGLTSALQVEQGENEVNDSGFYILVPVGEGSLWAETISNTWEWESEQGWKPRDRRLSGGITTRHLGEYVSGTDEALGEELGERVDLMMTTTRGLAGLEVEGDSEVMKMRNYLNGLVEMSIIRTQEQMCNIAFAKTHKTASTTLAMILVRYARRHNKTLASFGGNHVSAIPLNEAAQQVQESGQRVDVMHYHYTNSGSFTDQWEHAKKQYADIMRENERVNFVTVMRDHRSHFLSYYYYFIQPDVQLSVAHFFKHLSKRKNLKSYMRRLDNPMSFEFGIRTEEELESFILNELNDFRLVLLTERFDESLVILRRILGWEMIDLTYSRMMETKEGSRRWDGKELKRVPHFEDLPESVRESIDDCTKLDKRLYEAAVSLYEERKAPISREVDAELEEFSELQDVMNSYLQQNQSSLAQKWYRGNVQPYLGGPPFYSF